MNQITNPKTAYSPSDILIAEGLRKSYGPRQALQGLSFSLNAGRVLGFLGPTGAGKTTSIRILTTILEPESGHFIIDGIGSEYPEKIRRRIGVLPENLGIPRQVTGIEYLTYFGQLYGQTVRAARSAPHVPTTKSLGRLQGRHIVRFAKIYNGEKLDVL